MYINLQYGDWEGSGLLFEVMYTTALGLGLLRNFPVFKGLNYYCHQTFGVKMMDYHTDNRHTANIVLIFCSRKDY